MQLSTGIGGFVIAVLLAMSNAAAAGPSFAQENDCVPTAMLIGEKAITDELGSRLLLLGVTSHAKKGCPVLRAKIEALEEGYRVQIHESRGRKAHRLFGDLRTTATWIDSWLHDEFSASLLAVRSLPMSASETTINRLALPDEAQSVRSLSLATSSTPWHLGLGYEDASTDLDTDWLYLKGDACKTIGPICLGLSARLGKTKTPMLLLEGLSDITQYDVDATLSLRVPMALGKVSIEPRIGLGTSWMTTIRSKAAMQCTSMEGPDCGGLDFKDSPRKRGSLVPMGEVGITIVVPVAQSVFLTLEAGFDLRVLTAKDTFIILDPPLDDPLLPVSCPDGQGLDSDGNCISLDDLFSTLVLPGEPKRFYRLGLGLRVQL